jgi:catechol 2,3-dioxygenase-like lactoylglutathione lyase family enzyme
MNWTLEVVCLPVADIDRAKTFYADGLGFHVDHDTVMGEMRIVQLTPPGSGCSVVIGTGLTKMTPGSVDGLQLVVGDLPAAHAELIGRGVEIGPIVVFAAEGQRPAQPGDDLNNAGFFFFADPDGNGWAVQQITARGSD